METGEGAWWEHGKFTCDCEDVRLVFAWSEKRTEENPDNLGSPGTQHCGVAEIKEHIALEITYWSASRPQR